MVKKGLRSLWWASRPILVVAVIIYVMVKAARGDFSAFLLNLAQALNSNYADLFMLGGIGLLAVSGICRRLNSLYPIQKWTDRILLRPPYLAAAAFAAATAPVTPSVHHQHHTLHIFLAAMFLRFSGSEESDLEILPRVCSRSFEFLFCLQAFINFTHLRSVTLLLPSFLIVATCRTQEIFRLWCKDKPLSDSKTAKLAFKHFDGILIDKLLSMEHNINWPHSNVYYGYPDEEARYRDHLKNSGVFAHLENFKNQYSFLWVEASGLLMISVFVVQGVALVSIAKSNDSVLWKTLSAIICLFCYLYLVPHCLPGLLFRLDMAEHILGMDLWDLPREILRYDWFREIGYFMKDLFTKGITLQQHFRFGWKRWIEVEMRRVEGLELILHVFFFCLIRSVSRLALLFVAILAKATRANLLLKCKWHHKVAYFIAHISAGDILNTKRAILGAERALGTRKSCSTCISPQECNMLSRQMGISEPQNKSLQERRGIQVALFEFLQEAVQEASKESGNEAITSRLRPVLALVDQFYIEVFKIDHDIRLATDVKKDIIDNCNKQWSAYNERSQCKCVSEAEWKVIKIQMLTSMLLSLLEQPRNRQSPVEATLAGGPLYDWVNTRQTIILNCDFLTDYPPDTNV